MLETIYNDNDTHGHGTAIAGIISHNTINADIIIIKAPDIENGLDEDTLIDIQDFGEVLFLFWFRCVVLLFIQELSVENTKNKLMKREKNKKKKRAGCIHGKNKT